MKFIDVYLVHVNSQTITTQIVNYGANESLSYNTTIVYEKILKMKKIKMFRLKAIIHEEQGMSHRVIYCGTFREAKRLFKSIKRKDEEAIISIRKILLKIDKVVDITLPFEILEPDDEFYTGEIRP